MIGKDNKPLISKEEKKIQMENMELFHKAKEMCG